MKMQQTNMIGDTWKDRRIDYGLIDRINKQYEREGKIDELKGKLAKKKGVGKEKEIKEKEEQNPAIDIRSIEILDELREIKGNYVLQKGIYVIDFEIYVPNGCGLILEPGVALYFTKDAGITCNGRFEIKGRIGLEVLLTANYEKDGWKNLYLKGGAEAIVDYAEFSYGKGRENKNDNISGGAILLEAENGLKPIISINNSYFEKNSATFGGAIHNLKGDVRIKGENIFDNNYAELDGGAIYNNQGDITIKENNRFEDNSANEGGAIYNNQGDITIKEKNIFDNNSAIYSGGAIYNHRGDVRIKEKNIFEDNSACLAGAIRNYKGKLNINKSKNIFKNNKPSDIL